MGEKLSGSDSGLPVCKIEAKKLYILDPFPCSLSLGCVHILLHRE